MNYAAKQKDLIVLTADRNIEFSVRGILERRQSLRIRTVAAEFRGHPHKDPGCLRESHDFLRPFTNQYKHALVIFDHDGCGAEESRRETLESQVERLLFENGWRSRAAAIVIAPELDVWVWSDSPEVDSVLGWQHLEPSLRNWATTEGFLRDGEIKPRRPKETLEQALRRSRTPRSSILYRKLAERVSLERCIDPAFLKLTKTLQAWFPPT